MVIEDRKKNSHHFNQELLKMFQQRHRNEAAKRGEGRNCEVCYKERKGHSNALMSSMPLMRRRRMSMHSLLTLIIFLEPAPHLKQSEEQGIHILAAARSKSSITNLENNQHKYWSKRLQSQWKWALDIHTQEFIGRVNTAFHHWYTWLLFFREEDGDPTDHLLFDIRYMMYTFHAEEKTMYLLNLFFQFRFIGCQPCKD